ncbi:MAG: exodeoxyribonuclease VII small subunit [Lachnospiraceae bacterium]|jgi:Exonuclease VII small subunit.|nr:exodeoxyribonuclease VII small subunit [Lachnospiraceae bacterium]MCI8824382.1 exodeoxyribonuclease VII small subunit [Lachnospiraceae bacterium]MCI9369872.1 exodeoxyribonuclease VII small subunit [Lachnospiraceae bacterium]MDE7308606.1 exodeoxyribonuclease VII small subunit [Lachnospiraceae bacterium]
MAEKMTIEQGFDKLGEIMERMEETDISLEESFRLYNKGIKLVKQIKEKLDDTEKKLIVLEEEQI